MRRDTAWAIVLWIVLTAVGVWLAMALTYMPLAAGEQAAHTDEAIRVLTIYAVPVLTFVLVGLGYSVWRFQVVDGPAADGPPVEGHGGFSWSWLVVTTALAALLFIHPGLTGLLALERSPPEDLVVQLEAVQWHWNVTYPEQGLALDDPPEFVLPVHQTVRFEITSRDVIHSVWIPAFRLKQDAVPGRTTSMVVTPSQVGSFEDDFNLRLQCAELCGTGHARMFTPVRVVEAEEFQAWLAEQAAGQDGMDMEEGDGMDMGGEGAEEGDGHEESGDQGEGGGDG